MSTLTIFGIILGSVLVVAAAIGLWLASRFEKVGPNEVLIVSGRKSEVVDPLTSERVVKNFRVYHGGGTFVVPVRERVDRMSVELMTLEIQTPEFFTKFGVPIVVDAIAQIKVRSDDPIATATAAEMFLGKSSEEMNRIAHQMMQGHLRAVISTLPFEEIHANPEVFAQSVQRLTAEDLANMGVQVVSFTIRTVKDPSGYLAALGRPQLADVERNAVIGEANAQRDATVGKSEASREAAMASAKAREESRVAELAAEVAILSAEKERNARKVELEAEVARAQARKDVAYDLEMAKQSEELTKERLGVSRVQRALEIELEELEAQKRTKQLEHEIKRPVDAERYRIETLAAAEQARARMAAESEIEVMRLRGLAGAEIVRRNGEAEADAIRAKALAEAEGLKAKQMAEAEALEKRAEALKQYGASALLDAYIEKLPEIARAVSAPLSKIDKITLVSAGGGDTGMEKLAHGVTSVLREVPGVVGLLDALDVPKLVGKVVEGTKAPKLESGKVA